MTERFAVAVMGQDRPGIVAAVTAALLEVGANVEDVSTSILRGHFGLMLVVATPPGVAAAQVAAALGGLRGEGLAVAVWEVEGSLLSVQATHVLAVYGPDRAGIVHAVAQALAGLGISICDMACRLHEGASALYLVTVEVALPEDLDAAAAEAAVAAAVAAMGLEVSLNPLGSGEL